MSTATNHPPDLPDDRRDDRRDDRDERGDRLVRDVRDGSADGATPAAVRHAPQPADTANRLAELLADEALLGRPHLSAEEERELASLLDSLPPPATGPTAPLPRRDARGHVMAPSAPTFAADAVAEDLGRTAARAALGFERIARATGDRPGPMPAALRKRLAFAAELAAIEHADRRGAGVDAGSAATAGTGTGVVAGAGARESRAVAGTAATSTRSPSPRSGPTPSSSSAGVTGPGRAGGLWMWSGWAAAAAVGAFALLPSLRMPAPDPVVERVTAVDKSADVRRVPWVDPAGKGLSGDVAWSESLQRGYLRLRNLPANDPTRERYQLWVWDASRPARTPVDAGLFDVPASNAPTVVNAGNTGPVPGSGDLIIPFDPKLRVGGAQAFAVTIERPDGVVVSDRGRIAAVGGSVPSDPEPVAPVVPVAPAPPGPTELRKRREALLASAKDVVNFEWKDPAMAGVTGDVVWSDAAQAGYMRFRGLPANDPATEQYQLWIFDSKRRNEHPVDGGVFDVAGKAGRIPDGEVVVAINAKIRVLEAKWFAVTLEQPGGTVVSDRTRIQTVAGPVGH